MNKELNWIGYQATVLLHDAQINQNGGLMGLWDKGVLISALKNLKHYFYYNNPKSTLPEIAAIYAFKIAINRAFFDANKRRGQPLLFREHFYVLMLLI